MKTKAVAEVVAVAFIILAGALVAFLPAQEAQPANNPNFKLVPPTKCLFQGHFIHGSVSGCRPGRMIPGPSCRSKIWAAVGTSSTIVRWITTPWRN